MITFKTLSFDALSTQELYDLLSLRNEVFVVEQNCAYQDLDGLDPIALHLCGFVKQDLVAYARLFAPGIVFELASMGRVLVKPSARKKAYGHLLVQEAKREIERQFSTQKIDISAQAYLQEFYQQHGFSTSGALYLEDNIPHVHMRCL